MPITAKIETEFVGPISKEEMAIVVEMSAKLDKLFDRPLWARSKDSDQMTGIEYKGIIVEHDKGTTKIVINFNNLTHDGYETDSIFLAITKDKIYISKTIRDGVESLLEVDSLFNVSP